MGYWVYLARCGDGTFYTGATTDVERRLREHNSVKYGAKYTAARLPVSLAQAWEVPTWSAALRLEIAIKKCARVEKEGLANWPEEVYSLAKRYNFDFVIEEWSGVKSSFDCP